MRDNSVAEVKELVAATKLITVTTIRASCITNSDLCNEKSTKKIVANCKSAFGVLELF